MSWKDEKRTDAPWLRMRSDYHLLKPGLYLFPYHGYASEEDRHKAGGEWGDDGPMIGPLEHVSTTYGYILNIRFSERANLELYREMFPERCWADRYLVVRLGGEGNSLFCCGDMQYGDWEVFCIDDKGEQVK